MTNQTTKPTCTWERAPISFGAAAYVTDCGHHVNNKTKVSKDDLPDVCWGCGKPIVLED